MKLDITTGLLKSGKFTLMSTTALLIAFGGQMAYAQVDDIDDDEDTVVATGIRQSIKTAADFKRNADTAVDSITASDVGALPDLSVAEALARVPGVVVQRFDISDGNGGDFPSPEGGGNLIRGLSLVRSEFNGRDAFSANGGRALDFGTIPPELIGAVDVYKNSTADLIEGGIGGTINLRTLEPFDRDGAVAVVSLDGTYTDLREEFAPDFSAILGNRWDTGAGEFGLLGSYSTSELKSDLHGFQIGQLTSIDVGDGLGRVAVPTGFQLRTNDVDRKRDSYYVAGQWQDNAGNLKVTAKYSLIENEVDSDERTLESFPDGESAFTGGFDERTQGPAFLTGGNRTSLVGAFTTVPFTTSGLATCNGSNDPNGGLALCETQFGADRLFTSGIITNNNRDWTGIDGNAGGAPVSNLGIHQEDRSKTDDISINVKWRPADQWFVNLDAHKTTAEFQRSRLWAGSRFFSDFYFVPDLDNPRVALIPDPTGAVSPNFRAGTNIPAGDPANVGDPDNSYLLFAADEFQENEGELYAFSGDVEYEFANDGWFDSVKFGARYAERDQINRSAGLNWAAVSPPWAGGYAPYSGLDDPSNFEAVDYSDFFRGNTVIGSNTQVIFPDRGLLSNYDAFASFIANDSLIQSTGTDWNPLRVDGVVDYAGRGQVGDVSEKTTNFYARLDFGNEFANGMSIDGNVGVRYSGTEVIGNGQLRFNEVVESGIPTQVPSFFSPEAVAYFNQDSIDQSGTIQEDDRFLPSLNVKWNLNDNSLIRFGVSDAITRPNIAQLRSDQVAVGNFRFISTDDLTVPADERITDIQLSQISVFGGNPDLKPIESRNWDVSYESYYGDNNSFTFALFRKDIKNNIIYASQTQDTITLDGRQVPIVFSGDLNQDEATIQGAEVAITHFFEEWPSIFGNLGVQANYTFIDAETNAPLPIVDADGDGNPDDFQQIFRFGENDFLGLSEGAANLIGIYQDDNMEVRLAYNWRSDYLSSYRDFITGNPIYQEERGYLDGSFKYDFNENFQFRAQVANILDTRANASQVVDANGQRYGRTSFIGDRRIKVGVRYSY